MTLGGSYINKKIINFVILSFLFSLLSACGGGSDSNSASQNSTKQYQGFVQKGPFEVGTDVVISQLDSSGFPTGNAIITKIENVNGRFTYQLPKGWNIGEDAGSLKISAEGFYFDESNGEISGQKLNLSAITNTPESSAVNLLTDWAVNRVEVLLKSGQNLKLATEQSEKELIKIFGIDNIHQLDISQLDSFASDNALLLLLSGALMEVAEQNAVDSQQISNEIATDFSDDGKLTELGDDWFIWMQELIRNNPHLHANNYSKALKEKRGLNAPDSAALPRMIPLASRPSAVLPKELIVSPGETVMLDGRASHVFDEGSIINYTWFRVDQQVFNVPVSDRFIPNPVITAPSQELELLYALVVTDSQKLTDTAVIKIIVRNPVIPNNAPIAVDDTKSTSEDTLLALGVVDIVTPNDTDADGDVLSINAVSSPINGVVALNSAGVVLFTPTLNFVGTASFLYTVSDGKGGTDTATVTIAVTGVNDDPTAVNDTKSTNEDAALTLGLTDIVTPNDTDVDGDTLVITAVSAPVNGTIVLNGDGTVTFTPTTNFVGAGSFDYTVSDGNGGTDTATVTVNVTGTNDAPVAVDDTKNTNEDTALILGVADIVTTNDTDADGDTLSISAVLSPLNGTIILNGNGTVTFIPTANFFGTASFIYTVSDGKGGTDTATVTVTVVAVNDDPVAVDDSTSTNKDVAIVLGVAQIVTPNDTDVEGDTLTITVASTPVNGSVALTNGAVIFTPTTSFVGTASFIYTVSDGNGGTDTASVIIDVVDVIVATSSTYFKSPSPQMGFEIDGIDGNFYGRSVALSADGTTLAVGMAGTQSYSSAVYIYTLDSVGWSLQATLTSVNLESNDAYGRAIALSNDGNTLVVGATFEDGSATGIGGIDNNDASGSGAAYIFSRTGAVWSSSVYVKASNAQANDNFGKSVSISGDGKTIAVGAPSEDSPATGVGGDQGDSSAGSSSGAVYIFLLTGSTWSQEAYVKALLPFRSDQFGSSVSLNGLGNSLIVGAIGEDTTETSSGAIYHFRKSASVWSQQQLVKADTPVQSDNFGQSLALSNDGNTFVAASNTGSGTVYAFNLFSGIWIEEAIINADVTETNDRFGSSVAISADGNKFVIGAAGEDSSSTGTNIPPSGTADPTLNNAAGDGSGAIYIFERVTTVWSQNAYVKATNTDAGDAFGSSVALSDDGKTIAVGAPNERSKSPGINGDQTNNDFLGAGAVYVNPHLQ